MSPKSSLLVVASFSRHADALAWARQRLQETFGPIIMTSPEYSFHHTRYYETTMGEGLRKQLLGFQTLVRPDCLVEVKSQTIAMEQELARTGVFPETRPLNLDPGLLQLGKFMLATTKDKAHRIYLGNGIFAEVTLRFEAGSFQPWPWTYADYQEPEVREFLKKLRDYYKSQLEGLRRSQTENPLNSSRSSFLEPKNIFPPSE